MHALAIGIDVQVTAPVAHGGGDVAPPDGGLEVAPERVSGKLAKARPFRQQPILEFRLNYG